MLRLPLFKLDAEALAILTADRFNLRLTASGIEGGGVDKNADFFSGQTWLFLVWRREGVQNTPRGRCACVYGGNVSISAKHFE